MPSADVDQVRNAGAVFVGRWSTVARGRLRDRWQPRAADRWLGPVGWRPRPRDVSQAGDRAAADTRRPRCSFVRPSKRSPRPRACRRMPRRSGDEGARTGLRSRTPGPRRPTRSHGRGDRSVAGAAVRPEHAATARCPRRGRERSPVRSPVSAATRRCGLRAPRRAIADYNGVEPENVVLGAGADDLILLCARAFAGPGDRVAVPPSPDLLAVPDRGPARRSGGRRRATRSSRLRVGRTIRPGTLDPSARRAAARRRRGVLRVRGRDRAAVARRRRCHRAAHVLEVVRARGRANRLRTRGGGRGGGTERASGSGADLDARRQTLALAALRVAARRSAGRRGARAARLGAARPRSRAGPFLDQLPLRPGRGRCGAG